MLPGEEFTIEGVSVASGVSEQPSSDAETYQGALNRAINARLHTPDADFWVGLEGGIEAKETEMESYAWIVVASKDDRIGKAKTGAFFLPSKVVELIREGKELGEADDIVFGKTNSKQSNGAVGLLTHDVITRPELYEGAIVLALISYKNPNLYPNT